jgi:hypothetical protein
MTLAAMRYAFPWALPLAPGRCIRCSTRMQLAKTSLLLQRRPSALLHDVLAFELRQTLNTTGK